MSIPKNATLSLKPFKVQVPQVELEDLQTLLKVSRLAPATYENQQLDGKFGLSLEWVSKAKARWEGGFDWRKHESHINSFPQYIASLKNRDGKDYDIHFIGCFSDSPDAIPIVLLHGWPGSFVEFLGIIPYLTSSTSPAFHVIVPSLPGYAFSSQPTTEKDFVTDDAAYLVDQLMTGLGFGEENGGYIAQGGDIGSFISRLLAANYPACKAAHLNMIMNRSVPTAASLDDLSPQELEGIKKGQKFRTSGNAYAMEHATRPATIGIVLASNPIALLAWIGEKFLEWTDEDPTVDKILEIVTLWWFTQTFPKGIYSYRELFVPTDLFENVQMKAPFGFSNFRHEISPIPESWARTKGDMVFYRYHEKGGHFAAMEQPEALAEDLKEFANIIKGLGK
ncbi:hypothetical protein RUND412_009516 [Rhizina undulata]